MYSKNEYKEVSIFNNGKPTIGLLLGAMSSYFHEGILRGASLTAKEKGYNIITFSGGSFNSPFQDIHPRSKVFELVDLNILDGIVITASSHFRYTPMEDANHYLKKLSALPLININGDYEDIINVNTDFENGFDELFNHYVNVHGYKRIALFRGPINHSTSDRRMEIYINMLKKYELDFDEDLIVYGDLNRNSARYFVEEFFDRRKVKCDAIVSVNDKSAIEIMYILASRGIRVPEDIALSGSMGMVEGIFTKPQLTSIKSLCLI